MRNNNNPNFFQNFNQNMNQFSNLMNNFSSTMNSNPQNANNFGAQMGEFGQKMGEWGQNMSEGFDNQNVNFGNFESNSRNSGFHGNGTTYTNVNFNTNNNNFNFGNSYRDFENEGYEEDERDYGNFEEEEGYQNEGGYGNEAGYEDFNYREEESRNSNLKKKSKKKKNKKMKPENLLNNKGKKEYKKKKFLSAIKFFEAALKLKQNHIFLTNISLCYIKLKNYKKAKKFINESIKLNPNKSKSYRILGYIDMSLSEKNKDFHLKKISIDSFQIAVDLKKNEKNTNNYKLAKKAVFLGTEKNKYISKTKLTHYLSKFENINNFQKFLKKNFFEEKKNIPQFYQCAINLDIIEDPLQTPSGISYEKNLLLEYLDKSENCKDPLTSTNFRSADDCIDNKILKKSLKRFLRKNCWSFQFCEDDDYCEKFVYKL